MLSFYQTFFKQVSQDNDPKYCLFIYWGPPGDQRAIDISVSNSDDEVLKFSDIRRRWFEYRGRWQRLFPFHSVVAVKEIKVNIFKTTQVEAHDQYY